MSIPKYEQWAQKHGKVCECLERHFISQSSSDYEQVHFELLSKGLPTATTDKRELTFLDPLFTKMILSQLKSIKFNNMLEYCREEYPSRYQIRLIDEFEKKYSEHNPIWWFTRDSFFQGMINRALQIYDLRTLCMMNPFLRDLDWKLSELQRQQSPATPKKLILYLSQSMGVDDLRRLKSNIGGLMCINQFLFANTQRSIALMFIEHQNSTTVDKNNVNVLFDISIPPSNLCNVPLANIGDVSEFVHEQEYLLSMTSIHRIDGIDECRDVSSTWSVHLTLMDQNHSQLARFTTMINQEFLDEDQDLGELGSNIIAKFYQFKSTEKLYEQQLFLRF